MTCDLPVGGEGVWVPHDDAGGSDRAEKPVLPTHGAHVGKRALLTQVCIPYRLTLKFLDLILLLWDFFSLDRGAVT